MRKPIRSAGIVIKNNKILLIHRINKLEYYVFPGGGVEDDEINEDTVVREFLEETTVEVKVNKLLYHHHLIDTDGSEKDQYFYLCDYISGEPKLGQGNELKETNENTDFYEPLWFPVRKLSETLVFPLEIRDWLLEDINNNFMTTPKSVTFKISDLRQTL